MSHRLPRTYSEGGSRRLQDRVAKGFCKGRERERKDYGGFEKAYERSRRAKMSEKVSFSRSVNIHAARNHGGCAVAFDSSLSRAASSAFEGGEGVINRQPRNATASPVHRLVPDMLQKTTTRDVSRSIALPQLAEAQRDLVHGRRITRDFAKRRRGSKKVFEVHKVDHKIS